MTERSTLEPNTDEAGLVVSEDDVLKESLWKIRLTLFRRTLRKNWKLFVSNKVGVIGLAIIIFFGILAIAPTILFRTGIWDVRLYHPVVGLEENPPVFTKTIVNEVNDPQTEVSLKEALLDFQNVGKQVGDTVEQRLQPAPPSWQVDYPEGGVFVHLLGTDPLGRDVFSQLMTGARAAFLLGIIAALVTVIIATAVGSISAYFGGALDAFFMRLADLLIMIPFLAILIVMNSVLSFEVWHLALLIGLLSGFGGVAIVLKSQALSVKVKPFIDAARVAGGSNGHIVFTHLVPNVMPLSFLYMMFTVTTAIQGEAALSFLGLLNIDMSWGLMLQLASVLGYLLQIGFWWLLIPAGFSVSILAAAFFLVGRAMDEVVNPRLRKR